jgi:zinc protease
LCAAVINESGLGSLEKDELDRALTGKKTEVWFKVEEDRFLLKGKTTPKEIELLFQLLYAHIQDPGFRQDSYDLVLKRLLQRHQALSKSVDGAVELFGKRFFAGGDGRFGIPAYSEFEKITLNDIRKWIDPALKHGRLELTVVGDTDLETISGLAGLYLGALPERNGFNTEKDSRKPVFPNPQRVHVKVESQIPKGLVIVAYPTDDFWDIGRTRRLSVLSSVFSDRLRVRVREKIGAAYSPYAFNRPYKAYPGYGVFQAFISINPDQVDPIIDEVKKIAADMALNGITGDELTRAVKPILTGINDRFRTNDYWLNSVLTGSTDCPEQLEWSRTIVKDFSSITADEISTYIRTYLNNGKSAIFVATPTG